MFYVLKSLLNIKIFYRYSFNINSIFEGERLVFFEIL